ncbi:MAG: DUF2236 domain-containing protein, partial [Bacteroidetes bacterium]|nr:DUF2236 domain-containing protein [Bacteroidota bacterium]
FQLLKQAQALVCPRTVNKLLKLTDFIWLKPILASYKIIKTMELHHTFRNIILPKTYRVQIQNLDVDKY